MTEEAVIQPTTQDLDRRAVEAIAESALPALPPSSAKIQGVAVDAVTGEPVPHLLLRLGRGKKREAVETDSSGRFEAQELDGEEAVMVAVEEPPGSARRRRSLGRRQPSPAGLELRVDVGPTYHFEIETDGSVSPDDLDATLLLPSKGYYFGDEWERVAVREGATPWARMPFTVRGVLGPAVVALQSRDGYWQGQAPVETTVGIQASPVRVVLRPSGTYAGRVVDDLDRPLDGVRVYISPAVGEPQGFPRVFRTESDGAFTFPWLPAGSYEVATANDWYDPLYELARSEIQVLAGGTVTGTLRMDRVPSAGAVRGVLRSLSGEPTFVSVQLELQSKTHPKRRLVTLVRPKQEDGRALAEFSFDAVPEDEYTLSIIGQEGRKWRPHTMRVTPPAEGLEFILEDLKTVGPFAFLVSDAGTGNEIESFRLAWHLPDGTTTFVDRQESSKPVLAGGLGNQGSPRWTVYVPGYRPACGDESGFSAEIERDLPTLPPEFAVKLEPLRAAKVRLERGWGARVNVKTLEGLPVQGARVLLDGREVGNTDDLGAVVVAAPHQPKSIVAVRSGWQMLEDTTSPYASAFGQVELRMIPEEK